VIFKFCAFALQREKNMFSSFRQHPLFPQNLAKDFKNFSGEIFGFTRETFELNQGILKFH